MEDISSRLYDINEDLFAVLKDIEEMNNVDRGNILFHIDVLEDNINKIKKEIYKKIYKKKG